MFVTNLSVAAVLLKAIVHPARGWTQVRVAKEIGCTQQSISCWLLGKAKPEEDSRLALDRLFGISPPLWDAPYMRKAG